MSALQLYREAYDLLLWVLSKTEGFPKSKRFSLERRLEDACIDLVLACYRYP